MLQIGWMANDWRNRTKKYLKKKQLRDWLRVVSDAHGKMELKFFNVVGEEAEKIPRRKCHEEGSY
jgi:hypothetical protein